MIAALYVEKGGPYFTMLDVDPWGIDRDARTYGGPHPVVAHPPCGPWGALRHLHVPNRDRLNDADCGPIAFEQVRRFGGVLEQPAGSLLFAKCGAPPPGIKEDKYRGRTIEVCQVEWGHPARKRTWIYMVGIGGLPEIRLSPFPGRQPTHWVSGGRDPNRKGGRRAGGVVPPGIKVCSAQQRRRTPPLFARFLVDLAASAWSFGWSPPRVDAS